MEMAVGLLRVHLWLRQAGLRVGPPVKPEGYGRALVTTTIFPLPFRGLTAESRGNSLMPVRVVLGPAIKSRGRKLWERRF